eukprot:m.150016 g.150016  ORF g.150016 m.150016 type:complete len:145 (+) comp17363_c1_seq1:152-586(+)
MADTATDPVTPAPAAAAAQPATTAPATTPTPVPAPANPKLPNPRADIAQLVGRRQELQRDLEALEKQIYNYEGTYLKESPYGNVVRGWSAFKNPEARATFEITDSDRLFSNSSASGKQHVEVDPEEAEGKRKKRQRTSDKSKRA